MFNVNLGSAETVDGRPRIRVKAGRKGHAVYGPYQHLRPGDYVISLAIENAGTPQLRPSTLVAVIDIACDIGRKQIVRLEVSASDLASGRRVFTIPFSITEPCRAEYRVWASGATDLLVDDNRQATRVASLANFDSQDAIFPEDAGRSLPFFVQHSAELRALFDRGIAVRIEEDEIRLIIGNIAINARCADDFQFIGELFVENAYNFSYGRQVVAIDVGLNIGLTSLHFATKSEVAAVHAFEPFAETYDRAMANLALNPALAAKISTYHLGLSDADYEGAVQVDDHGCSGAMTTVGVAGGITAQLVLRDAGKLLTPIIDDAEARGLGIVMKVDCEGSEFAVFRSLERAGLLGRISAFLVEWHAMFDDKTQETLIAPLRKAGFLIFDRSPPTGNGFFYAVRIG
jgi:FkbM family methyltransferase